jgi:hypothetical protein
LTDKTSRPASAAVSPSERIRRRIARFRTITTHISPYTNGLAPETREFVAELNKDSERHNLGVKFTALANKIEATGDIQGAASTRTLVGWFLGRAVKNGYLEGEDSILQSGNSQWRRTLRRIDKTKAGMRRSAAIEKAESARENLVRTIVIKATGLKRLIDELPSEERLALGAVRQYIPAPDVTNWPHLQKVRSGRMTANSTTWRKGGPNPKRKKNPDS